MFLLSSRENFAIKPRYGFYSLDDEDEDGIMQDELPFDLPEEEDQDNQEDGINQDGYDDGLPF